MMKRYSMLRLGLVILQLAVLDGKKIRHQPGDDENNTKKSTLTKKLRTVDRPGDRIPTKEKTKEIVDTKLLKLTKHQPAVHQVRCSVIGTSRDGSWTNDDCDDAGANAKIDTPRAKEKTTVNQRSSGVFHFGMEQLNDDDVSPTTRRHGGTSDDKSESKEKPAASFDMIVHGGSEVKGKRHHIRTPFQDIWKGKGKGEGKGQGGRKDEGEGKGDEKTKDPGKGGRKHNKYKGKGKGKGGKEKSGKGKKREKYSESEDVGYLPFPRPTSRPLQRPSLQPTIPIVPSNERPVIVDPPPRKPDIRPSSAPTPARQKDPVASPTTGLPSVSFSFSPTDFPTFDSTMQASSLPAIDASSVPTIKTSANPTTMPVSRAPAIGPTTLPPSASPTTGAPTRNPTNSPSLSPSTSTPSMAPITLSLSTSTPSMAPTTLSSSTSTPSMAPITLSPSTSTPSMAPITEAPAIGPTTSRPTQSPITTNPTVGPTVVPTTAVAIPTQSPTTAAPTQTMVDGIRVSVSRFEVDYDVSRSVNDLQFDAAERITLEYLRLFMEQQFRFNSLTDLIDFRGTTVATDNSATMATYDVDLIFARGSIDTPSSEEADLLVFAAFNLPFVPELVKTLSTTLPQENPFKQTSAVTYNPVQRRRWLVDLSMLPGPPGLSVNLF